MKHKKPIIKKLKYPQWFNIVFYILTVIAPLALTMVQGFRSGSSVFRFTFGLIAAALISWSFIRKFIIVNKEKQFKENKIKLEHEYEVGIGKMNKIKYVWFTNEIWLSLINIVDILLKGLLIFVVAEGISKGLMKIEGLTTFIVLCYLTAYSTKFIYITSTRNKEYKEEEVEDGEQTE